MCGVCVCVIQRDTAAGIATIKARIYFSISTLRMASRQACVMWKSPVLVSSTRSDRKMPEQAML